MQNLSRLLRFVRPYRHMFVASVGCAIVIALLWGANLAAALPVVRVLFENRNLHVYVDNQIADLQSKISDDTNHLETIPEDALERRARTQRHLSEATNSLTMYSWIKSWVLPWIPTDKFNTIALIFGLLIVATIIKGFFIFLQELLVGEVVQATTNRLRYESFRKALALDYLTLSKEGTSGLMSRMTNDVEQLAMGMRTFGIKLIREPMKAGVCIMLAFALNWRLTMLSLVVVPMLGLMFHRFGSSLKKAARGSMESMALIYSHISETFGATRIVLAFGGQQRQRRKFIRASRGFYNKAMKVIRVTALVRPTTEIMGVIAVFAVVIPGGYLVLRNTNEIWGIQLSSSPMDIAELMTLYALLAGTLDPVRKLSSVYGQFKRATAASDRIFELIEMESHVKEPETPRAMKRATGAIRFADVSFHYPAHQPDATRRPAALQRVNLSVKPGEIVAVVGSNGSGKSTLLSLLPRFFDPTEGQVLIDDVDIRAFRTADVRSQIGLVTQETMLFDDTIHENIRFGKPNATPEEVEDAAHQASVLSFVRELPEGFETRIGEKGNKLSGGQRQRVALARAIIRNPPILILDEATSAIDSSSEQVIHRVLKDFAKGRTVFIISHVISDAFLDLVTRIVIMEQGAVVGEGTHEKLLQTCPEYQRLCQSQVPLSGKAA